MNDYQKEQWDALQQITSALKKMPSEGLDQLRREMQPYLNFRQEVEAFLNAHFSTYCIRSCFENQQSVCCSKDGIITFWADVVINAVLCSDAQLESLFEAIRHPHSPHKCIYLNNQGCCWQLRPLVCAMFLCDGAQQKAFADRPDTQTHWSELNNRARTFRWPDQPVLFDSIEINFMAAGCRSPLMYLNTSPGLLSVKRKAGLLASTKGR
jgi:hypothetical protein